MHLKSALVLATTLAAFSAFSADELTMIDRPANTPTNNSYFGSRQPLGPARFIALPSGSVQVAAAEALARLDQWDEALPVLERWVQQTKHWPFALRAGNVLDRLGESARLALPAAEAAPRDTVTPIAAEHAKAQSAYPDFLSDVLKHYTGVLEGSVPPLIYPKVAVSDFK